MALWKPTRRELIAGLPLAAGAAAFPQSLSAGAGQANGLSFLVVGDWGRDGGDYQKRVADWMGHVAQAKKAAGRPTVFVATTGDNFYPLGVNSVEDGQWHTSFEEIYIHPGLAGTPWYAALGNHDYGGRVEAQIGRDGQGRWNMPKRWYPVSGSDFGRDDLDLFFIDTVVWLGRESFPFRWLGSDIREDDQRDQATWLVAALHQSTAKYKLVFGHHGIYSIGRHGGHAQMRELDDVLRRFDVTAYVSGHAHCLYHIRRNGMHYICSGGGSQVLTSYTGAPGSRCVLSGFCDADLRDDIFPVWHRFLPEAGFASFDLGPTGLTFELFGVGGTPDHWQRPGVRHSFPIP